MNTTNLQDDLICIENVRHTIKIKSYMTRAEVRGVHRVGCHHSCGPGRVLLHADCDGTRYEDVLFF